MTEQLHKLIDSGATQPVINERVAGILEALKLGATDHEKRIRYIERYVNYVLGAMGLIGLGVTIVKLVAK
jgi:hypothetical protein